MEGNRSPLLIIPNSSNHECVRTRPPSAQMSDAFFVCPRSRFTLRNYIYCHVRVFRDICIGDPRCSCGVNNDSYESSYTAGRHHSCGMRNTKRGKHP